MGFPEHLETMLILTEPYVSTDAIWGTILEAA